MEKRPHIVQSAQVLFTQFGLKRVTMDDIAREAQVSKATIYRHFKNKKDIFDQVVSDEVESLLSLINSSVNDKDSVREKLAAHLTVRLGRVTEFVNFYRVTQESWADYWPFIAGIRSEFITREQHTLAKIIRQGVQLGELSVEDPDKAARVMVLALASVDYQWALNEGEFSLSELVDTMINMMLSGIGEIQS